jgi:hypothetical protein
LEDDRANYEQELVDYVNNTLSPKNKKMLNLTRDWLKSFLPHVLQKVPLDQPPFRPSEAV